jgi:ribosomal-protein-alanine N-acetyltransferase
MSRPTLQTPRLILRPFQHSDAPDVQRLAGDIEISRVTLNIPHPYENGMAEAWISKQQAAPNTLNFAIIERENGAFYGCVGLSIDETKTKAELGYWIGVPFWNRGYCTEAARALVDYAFDVLNLEHIEARHLDINPASGSVMKKLGLTLKGVSHSSVRKGDQLHSLTHYAITRTEWLRNKK